MSAATTEGQQPSDFPDTPAGWARRWAVEVEAAKKALEDFRKDGHEIDRVFRDEREGAAAQAKQRNLFTANVQTQMAMLFGRIPKTDVSRRYADADDDVARISSELQERLLNGDFERSGDTTLEAVFNALSDRLLPGLGQARVRYEVEMGEGKERPAIQDEETGRELAPAVPAVPTKSREEACVDWVPWDDFLYSKCRSWGQVSWVGFAADMGQEDFTKRFGKELWAAVPKQSTAETDEAKAKDPYARVRVWEIWHKPSKKAFWWVEGYSSTLDIKEDPLRLDGFFPCPRPLMANLTTSKLVPRADYTLCKDLYESINNLTTRINLLQSAVRAAGVYSKDAGDGVKRLLDGKATNTLVPVENWAMFAEKGGVKGVIDWLPLDQIVNALQVLTDRRNDEIDALHQDSGFSDIMRGQATQAGATATEQAAKARFGSVRMQRMQDEFARFVSDLMRLKGEVVAKHFDAATILERSNAKYAYKPEEQDAVMQAVELMKSEYACYRVEVKPESVALQDFSQLKADKTEVLQGLATFFTAVAPIAQGMPQSMPFLLQLLQNAIAGLKGAGQMESTIDAAIVKVEQAQAQAAANPQQQPEDPKLATERAKQQTTMMKAEADIQKQQLKHAQDVQRIGIEVVADRQREADQAELNVREAVQKQVATNALKPKEQFKPGGSKP